MEIKDIVYRPTESINNDKSYELSALINADSFFYGIFDYGSNLKCAFGLPQSSSKFSDLVSAQEMGIRKAKIGIVNTLFTLVPDKEFAVKDSFQWLSSACRIDNPEDYIIRNDYSDEYKLRVVYAVPKPLMKDIKESIDNCSLVHFVFSCLDSIPNTGSKKKVRLIKLDKFIVIVVKDGNQLLLANMYDYQSNMDILYFLSLVFDRLNLDSKEQHIELAGMFSKEDNLIDLLLDYYGNIQLAEGYLKLIYNEAFSEYHFLPLYCISKCA